MKPQYPDEGIDTEQMLWQYDTPDKTKQIKESERIGKAGIQKLKAAFKFLHKPPPLVDSSNRCVDSTVSRQKIQVRTPVRFKWALTPLIAAHDAVRFQELGSFTREPW
jgi:hypothetical protein